MASTSRHTLDDGAVPGADLPHDDEHIDLEAYIHERRAQRLRRDPHYEHPLRRIYIGPSPVSSSSAAKVAAVMRHDVMQEKGHKRWYSQASSHHRSATAGSNTTARHNKDGSLFPPPPIALGVVGGTGTFMGGGAYGWRRRPAASKPGSEQHSRQASNALAKTAAPALPAHRPSEQLGPLASNEEQAARPGSTAALERHVSHSHRRSSWIGGGILRHTRSADLGEKRLPEAPEEMFDAGKQLPVSAPSDSVRFAKGMQQSRRQQFEQASVSHVVASDVARRRASEGIGTDARKDGGALPLLNEAVTEEDPWINEDEHDTNNAMAQQQQPTAQTSDNRALRQMGSHRSLGMRAPNAEGDVGPEDRLLPPNVSRLRNSVISTGSHGNESARNSIIIHSPEESSESQIAELGKLKADATQEGSSSMLAPPNERTKRSEELRARARQRFEQSRVGQARLGLSSHDTTQALGDDDEQEPSNVSPLSIGFRAPQSSGRRAHTRNMSKQSHMSHASTANSIATRFSDGSFGASGGFRARVMRMLGTGNDTEVDDGRGRAGHGTQRSASGISGLGMPSSHTHRKRASSRAASLSSQAIRAIARSHGGRVHVRGGVVAGAVGTSAGGTKWVGQSFKVGERFLQATTAREAQLLASEYEAKFAQKPVAAEQSAAPKQDAAKSTQDSQRPGKLSGRSTSQVLDTFARRAETADEQRVKQTQKRASTDVNKDQHDSEDAERDETTPALVGSSFGSETSDRAPATPPRSQAGSLPLDTLQRDQKVGHRGKQEGLAVRLPVANGSRESLVSIPQDTTVADIENRNGWADIMGFINGKTRSKTSNGPVNTHEQHEATTESKVTDVGAQLLDNEAMRASPLPYEGEDPHAAISEDDNAEGNTLQEEKPKQTLERPQTRRDYSTAASSMGATFVSALSSATADSVGQPAGKTMSTQEALKHPEPPLAAEEKFPEATHALTRRISNPGIAPGGATNEAASDHEVVVHNMLERKGEPIAQSRPWDLQRSTTTGGDQPLVSAFNTQPQTAEGMRKTVQFKSGDVMKNASNDRLSAIKGGRERQRNVRGDAKPADPREVLSRTSEPTSDAGKEMLESADGVEEPITSRSILKRDRMLVRVAWTPSEDLPRELTEHESRKYPLHFNDTFREYMVVYRMGRLELWDDPSWAMWLAGRSDQLKLHLIAPLKPGRTFVSLYSPIDNIFCVSFQLGAGHHRGLLNLRRSGTHVWIFDARSVTLAADWMWELWRELGGHIPPVLDVSLPVLGVRVQLPIPDQIRPMENGSISVGQQMQMTASNGSITSNDLFGEGYKLITRDNVVRVVTELADHVPQWGELTKRLSDRGVTFGLAWRVENRLKWVQYDDTTAGQHRDWAVLVGSILCNTRALSSLEFRATSHYAHDVRMAGCTRLVEPPGIEGFLWRVKAVSGSLTRVYVSTHDGLLFVSRPSRAYPPERFVAADRQMGEIGTRSRRRVSAGGDDSLDNLGRKVFGMLTGEPSSLDDVDAQVQAYKVLERRRQFEQVTHADGYVDVRDLVLIRCLGGKGPEGRPTADPNDEVAHKSFVDLEEDGHSHSAASSTIDSDLEEEDVGGEEGYELASDRNALKQGRQIEFTMTNGRSIRLEAYSRSVACEWVQRITAISRYWKRREKVDALEMMDASGYDANFMGRHNHMMQSGGQKPSETSSNDRLAPLLSSIWNWCTLEACRGIVRSGRLFTKKKPYSAFTSRYCVLIGGRIMTYKLMTSNRTARSRQNAGIFHKRQETVIHLRDAYVYSGKLTEHMLVNGRTQGAGALTGTGGSATGTTRHTLPRIYGDGLQSVDEDEDCTFVIRYRPQRVQPTTSAAALEKSLRTAGIPGTQPPDGPTATVNAMTQATSGAPSANISTAAVTGTTAAPRKPETAAQVKQASSASAFASTQLLQDKTVNLIAMRARSRLERDLWVWAIDCERERVVRDDRVREEQLRQQGKTPWKAH